MTKGTVNNSVILPVYLPSGRPAPVVLTGEEAAELLRLEGDGQRTLKFYRDEGQLKGFRLGRRLRYRLIDVIGFLQKKAEEKS